MRFIARYFDYIGTASCEHNRSVAVIAQVRHPNWLNLPDEGCQVHKNRVQVTDLDQLSRERQRDNVDANVDTCAL